jgi:hypothetical protein
MDNKITITTSGNVFEIIPKLLKIEDLRDHAIKSAFQLLEIEKISYIIYVDDKFAVDGQKEEYKARLRKLKGDGIFITSEKFSSIDWTSPFLRFENQIVALWDGSDHKSDLLYEVCTHIHDEDSANVIPALEIEKCFGTKIKLMTPNQWFKDEYKLIKELDPDQKALCLFDFEFQSGNDLLKGKNGAQLAKSLIEQKELSEKIVCGIFSHKFTEIDEDEYRLRYAQDYSIDPTKFYTISKSRFAFDPKISAFVEGIKNLLLHPYVEKLKSESLDVLKTSNEKASEKIKEISPNTFNHIIQKSSLKEGVWEISTLFRLYGILSKEENFNIISDPDKRKIFKEDIERIRKIDLIQTGYNSTITNQQLIDLRTSELYLQGDIINRLHLPLTNGDIFKINGKEYILLVQPCNLALRAHSIHCGKRDYSYNTGMLIPLKDIQKDKLNITSEEVKVAQQSDKFNIAYFPGFQIISLDILDLSVFNADGKASINFNNLTLVSDVIHFPWLKRYVHIYKELLNYETKILEFKTVKDNISKSINEKRKTLQDAEVDKKDTLKQEIKILQRHLNNTEKNVFEITDLSKFKINCTKIYDENTRVLDMNIRRIKHYKSPYSDDLLQKFMLYLSRNAFEHDFTNG